MSTAISSLYFLMKKSVAAILWGLMLHTSIAIASEPVQPAMRIEEPSLYRQGFFDPSGEKHYYIRSLTPVKADKGQKHILAHPTLRVALDSASEVRRGTALAMRVHDCRYDSNSDSSLSNESVDQNLGWFPAGDLFRPLLADLKEPQFLISRWRVKPNEANDFAAAAVGFGENFGLYRFGLSGGRNCNGLQFNISGAVFAQFNLNTPSSDLVNADYIIGFPLTFRIADFSARLRLYHQSSHLGDEFILGSAGVERVNLSFEELEAILSYIRHFLRVYGGSGYLVHREPNLERLKWQYGIEVRLQALKTTGFRLGGHPVFFVAGSDIKHFQHHDYDANYSIKAGFEIFGNVSGRRLRLLAGFYNGFNPFGQFYDQKLRAFGLEIDLGF